MLLTLNILVKIERTAVVRKDVCSGALHPEDSASPAGHVLTIPEPPNYCQLLACGWPQHIVSIYAVILQSAALRVQICYSPPVSHR